MTVTAPRTRNKSPISERATCGGRLKLVRDVLAPSIGFFARERAGAAVGAPSRRARGHARLDLDHDREDHRPALGPLVQVLRETVLDLRLEQADLARVIAGVLDRRE